MDASLTMQGFVERATRWLGRDRPDPWLAAALGVACTLAATLLRLALDPILGAGYSFVTYFLAVIVAAAMGGFLGGGVALGACLVVAWWLFVPPQGSFALLTRRDATALVVFAVNAGLSGTVAALLRLTLAALTRAQARQALLVNELNHRVKNTLATVQALALQSASGGPTLQEFQARFGVRLRALAVAHDQLTRANWTGAELGALLAEAVAPYDPEGRRISREGPPVRLSPTAAVSVSLALHELAVNAAKYGAMAGLEGRVEVRWRYEGEALQFEWLETGVPGLQRPSRQGFGSRLLKAVARELDAEARSEITPDGLAYRWRIPLSSKLSRPPNAADAGRG